MEERYCMVRGTNSGVFAGTIKSRNGAEVHMTNARRIWYWDGAASLSQLANSGTSKPKNCKFPEAVPEVVVLDAIEIIPISEVAAASIAQVPAWKQ